MNEPTKCSGGRQVARITMAIAAPPQAWHSDESLCTHQIYRDGVLVYDGRPSFSDTDFTQPRKQHPWHYGDCGFEEIPQGWEFDGPGALPTTRDQPPGIPGERCER